MFRRASFVRSFFVLLSFMLAVAPLSPVIARGAADPGPTPLSLPDGGSGFFFPILPDAPISQPDKQDPHLVASGFGQPPNAHVTANGDDRENYDPTAWAVYEHQALSDVLSTANSNNYRVVDLFVEAGTNPTLYTSVFVSNTGSYAKSWWLLAGVTPTDLLNFSVSNNARIVVQKAFNDPSPGGSVLFYAVLVSNTGVDAKTWYFFKDQSIAQVSALWQSNNARLVQVNSYVRSATTYYDVVMVGNTGADTRTWWWYVNATPSDLGAHVNANNARVVDLDYDTATGNYNAIMTSCASGCPAWWWYFGVSTANLISTATQNGARIMDVNVRPGCGDQCWDILMVDNATTTIAGYTALPDVTLNYTNGSPQSITSDASGFYSFSVHTGWSGTVTPSKTGYSFSPASRPYSNVFSNRLTDNFIPAATATFADVPTSYWAWLPIETVAKNGITSGCSTTPKLFCPATTVTRDQMAVFLLRAEHGSVFAPPAPVGLFADVPVNHWAAAFIEQLAAEGITGGCSTSPKLYCPSAPVTRDQMAVFLLRTKHGSGYTPPAPVGIFADVPVSHWAAGWIEELAAEGVTTGCSSTPKLFCPSASVSRDQLAVFLVRMFGLK